MESLETFSAQKVNGKKKTDKKTPKRTSRQSSIFRDFSTVPKNAKGGVLVTEEEIRRAFDFFDMDKTGKIMASQLRERLNAFGGPINAKEIRFLLNGQTHLSLQDMSDLLLENEVNFFDPVVDAFHWFDPQETGYVDIPIAKKIFRRLGYGDFNDDDLSVLIETADIDKDGRVSLSDFQSMILSTNFESSLSLENDRRDTKTKT